MAEREAFLNAIRANPADDTPRLVFADWLDEHGQPDEAAFACAACAVRSAPREPDQLRPLAASFRRLAVRVGADFAAAVCGGEPAALVGPWVDPDHPDNFDPLRLAHRPGPPVVVSAAEIHGPAAVMGSGSHPDIVERVWDQLGAAFPGSACFVNGTPCLVQPWVGVMVTVCYGTAYALRVPPDRAEAADPDGPERVRHFSIGRPRDARREFGPDWVFGQFAADEGELLRAVFARYDPARAAG